MVRLRGTKQGIRKFYNQSQQYEVFQKNEGWITPQTLIKEVNSYISRGMKIIDVGCGPGLVGEELKKINWTGMLIGVDIAENRLKEALPKQIYTTCVQADADFLPFIENSFDFAISNAMVGLTGVKSIKEMWRLVRPNGYFACIACEIISLRWCKKRFQGAITYLKELPNANLILYRDLGAGYNNTAYNGEHFVFFFYQKVK